MQSQRVDAKQHCHRGGAEVEQIKQNTTAQLVGTYMLLCKTSKMRGKHVRGGARPPESSCRPMLATKVIHGFTNMSCSGRCTRANGDCISGCRSAITRRPTNKIGVGSAQERKALIVPCLQSQLCLALCRSCFDELIPTWTTYRTGDGAGIKLWSTSRSCFVFSDQSKVRRRAVPKAYWAFGYRNITT